MENSYTFKQNVHVVHVLRGTLEGLCLCVWSTRSTLYVCVNIYQVSREYVY